MCLAVGGRGFADDQRAPVLGPFSGPDIDAGFAQGRGYLADFLPEGAFPGGQL